MLIASQPGSKRLVLIILCQKGNGLEAAVIAGDIGNGGMPCEDKLVNKKRLTYEEEGGDKGVADLQFGVN